ncbi:hypothetical protein [Flavobacterium granuli]|uniref:Uncharacterized protein n=1 Tax=Flavobacterium granuli TaxID=280093 RepID=A0ABU1S770_9FLAO|nr:hypothetical protein [Flavobacterium granuli]MDR6846110.1 hypothetical protein [Flavobacterium granuli]
MQHLLATLRNVPFETIKEVLENDRAFQASEEMYLDIFGKMSMMKMKCYSF